MSVIIIIGDGMADEPIPQLKNRTPLEVAHTPYMNFLAFQGQNGQLKTVPDDYEVGSDTATLSILGYQGEQIYQGRSAFEAASLSIPVLQNEMVMRCNFISIENDLITSFTADHISTSESAILIDSLNKHFQSESFQFHLGSSYRHIFVCQGDNKQMSGTSPHNALMKKKEHLLLQAQTQESSSLVSKLNRIIIESQEVLSQHPLNRQRLNQNKKPANAISLWSPSFQPTIPPMQTFLPLHKGAVISAIPLIKGIGIYAGLDVIDVPGATGSINTNYKGKATAAIEALKTNDFVLLHVEACDEAAHDGNHNLKIKAIENIDQYIIGPIYEATKQWSNPPIITILPDHITSSLQKIHLKGSVPFLIYHSMLSKDKVNFYDEQSALSGLYNFTKGSDLIRFLFRLNKQF